MQTIKDQFERVNLLHYRMFCQQQDLVQNCIWQLHPTYTESCDDIKKVRYMLSFCRSCNPMMTAPEGLTYSPGTHPGPGAEPDPLKGDFVVNHLKPRSGKLQKEGL